MKRGLAVALLAALLTVPAASADWLHSGHDPGRTGDIPFDGPDRNLNAISTRLPGAVVGTPLIANGSVYLITEAREDWDANLTEDAVWRLDLATAETEKLVDLVGRNATIAPSLDLVISQEPDRLVAQEIPSGDELWDLDLFDGICAEDYERLGGVVFQGEFAYAPLRNVCRAESPQVQSISKVWRVNATSGSVSDLWRRPDNRVPDAPGPDLGVQRAQGNVHTSVPVLSVSGDRFYAAIEVVNRTGESPAGSVERQRIQHEVWAVGIQEDPSEVVWKQNTTAQEAVQGVEGLGALPDSFVGGGAAVGPSLVFSRLDAVTALNPAQGTPVWEGGRGEADRKDVLGPLSLGLDGNHFVATSPQTVYRFDARQGSEVWQRGLEDPRLVHGVEPTAVSDDTAWIPVYLPPPEQADAPLNYGIQARSLDDGSLKWTWMLFPEVGPSNRTLSEPAYGPGVFVWGGPDGTVIVIGETPASPEPVVEPSTLYPEPGEPVTVDLSSSRAGAQGPTSSYGADWGDDTPIEIQQGPVLNHTYEEAGDVEARFRVANDAGQDNTTTVTFHVGQSEPNWLSERFAPENQEVTFGVLGLAVALGGGAIGVARRYRERSRLQEELEAIEDLYEETRDRPAECEAQLTERKAHARGLLTDGYLTEEQFGVVESRIEDLKRELRMGAVEEEFAFLPYSLVTGLREMLEDGRVTRMEKDGFLAALEGDEMVHPDQKKLVRERIEAWFARDAGG